MDTIEIIGLLVGVVIIALFFGILYWLTDRHEKKSNQEWEKKLSEFIPGRYFSTLTCLSRTFDKWKKDTEYEILDRNGSIAWVRNLKTNKEEEVNLRDIIYWLDRTELLDVDKETVLDTFESGIYKIYE